MTDLHGVLAALTTPFTAEHQVDQTRLRSLVDDVLAGGVHGLVPAGSTGEFASLSHQERRGVVETVIDQAAGRVPVVAHTGAMTVAEAVDLSTHAEKAGCAALLVLPPYKDRLSFPETRDYFSRIAESVSIPLIVYNLPLATGVNLGVEDIAALAEAHENIRYVKDTSGDHHQVTRILHDLRDVITLLVGWDTMLFAALAEGAPGCILGATNFLARPLVTVHELLKAGDLVAARAEWDRIYPAMRFLVSGGYVGGVRGAMDLLGRSIGTSRPPTAGLTDERRAELRQILAVLEL